MIFKTTLGGKLVGVAGGYWVPVETCIQEQKQQRQDCQQLAARKNASKNISPPTKNKKKKLANNTGDLSRATMLAALSNLASCSSTALKAVLRLDDFKGQSTNSNVFNSNIIADQMRA